jgi:hypothetical protein
VWASKQKDFQFSRSYPTYNDYSNKYLKPQFQNIDLVVEKIGGQQELDADTLKERVIEPLATMMGGGIRKDAYARLTGSSTSTAVIATRCMAVLMCHTVSPQSYEANCNALYDNPNITGYLDCGPKK